VPKENSQRGIIPLVLIFIVIGVVAIGSAGYSFIKKANVISSQKRVTTNNKQFSQPSVTDTTQGNYTSPNSQIELSNEIFKYEPQTSDEPNFTINPPSGWTREDFGSAEERIAFASPKEDVVSIGGGKTASRKADIIVQVEKMKDYHDGTLEEISQYYESQLYNEINPVLVKSEKTTINEEAAWALEVMYTRPEGVVMHEIYYYFAKNRHWVIISGDALSGAWEKRAPQIQSSLNSFKFVD